MNSSKILKYLILLGVLALLLTPFIISYGTLYPYVVGKNYYFRIVTALIFAVWLILITLDEEYRPKLNLLNLAFAGFVISLLISNMLGMNPSYSFWSNFERMEGWITIFHLALLFMAISSTFKKVDWHVIFNTSIGASLIMANQGYQQVRELGWEYRIDARLGNSTYLGIYMLLNAFLAIYLLITHAEKIVEKITPIVQKTSRIFISPVVWLYFVAFLINGWAVFQSNTRGSILALIVGLATMGFFMAVLHKNKILKFGALILVVFVLIGAYTIYQNRDSDFVQNYAPLQRVTAINLSEGTANARIIKWGIAYEGFKERPVLGWGQGNFTYVFDKYYLPEHHGNELRFDRVHNLFLDWLIAGGAVGLLLYLIIYLGFLIAIFKTKLISINQKSAILAFVAAYVFHNLFVFDHIVSYLYFVFIFGFVGSLYGKEILACQKKLSDNMKFVLITIVIIFVPAITYLINMPSWKAVHELVEANKIIERDSAGQARYYFEHGILGNIEMFDKAISRNTFGNQEIRHRILVSMNQISRIENLDEQVFDLYVNYAVEQMEMEIENDPMNAINYYMLGNFLRITDRSEEVEFNLLRAIELTPNKQAYRVPLINYYSMIEEHEKSLALAKETYELDTRHDDLWIIYLKKLAVVDAEAASAEIKNQIAEGRHSRVEKMYQADIKNNPDGFNNYVSLAALYFQIDELEKSIEILTEARNRFEDLEAQFDQLIKEIEEGNNPLGKSY